MNATLDSILGQFDYWRAATMPAPLTDKDKLQVIVGCGTSYNLALSVAAAMIGAGLKAVAVPGGEWVARPEAYVPAGSPGLQIIALSRSGETTETVQAASTSRAAGHHVIAITCAPGSALSRAADETIEFATHPAEGIVMTASASLMLLAGYALAGLDVNAALTGRAEDLLAALAELPVSAYAGRSHFVFLGGGANFGIALEGALKLQEMAITYTQGFHPGEYRHGPMSLVDARTAVVMLYRRATRDDEAALVAELQAKGAWVLGLGGPGDASFEVVSVGDLVGAEVLPALQLLGETYAAAHDIDTTKPRHLSKVVMLDA